MHTWKGLSNIPIAVRVPAVLAVVLVGIVVSTTVLNAVGVGGHGADAGHVMEMTDRTGTGSNHGMDMGHGSGDSMPRMDHSATGSGHTSALSTAVPK